MTDYTAAILIIGNEILSGRTQDKNLNTIAIGLTHKGIKLMEARVIPDIESVIIETVNTLRKQYTYVFTSGGIGPTHDDITAASVAKAFKTKLELNEDALVRLKKHYDNTSQELNEARRKMAYIPKGASLIDNPVSAAPGFQIENVYVMAGVPRILQAMFDFIYPTLAGGEPILSHTVSLSTTEGVIADKVTALQETYADVEIGSYPFIRDGKLGVSLVLRGRDTTRLTTVSKEIHTLAKSMNVKVLAEV